MILPDVAVHIVKELQIGASGDFVVVADHQALLGSMFPTQGPTRGGTPITFWQEFLTPVKICAAFGSLEHSGLCRSVSSIEAARLNADEALLENRAAAGRACLVRLVSFPRQPPNGRTVGGEAVKVYMPRRHGVASRTGTSSVVVGRSAQTTAQLFYILLASLVFLQLAGDQPGLRVSMLLVLAGGTVALAGFFWVQRRGLFASALAVTRLLRLNLRVLERHRAKILDLDQAITGFYREQRPRFFASAAFYMGGWLLDTLEIYLVAALIGMPITWPQALAVEAFTSVVKILGLWIPGTLGVQESGIVMLGRLAGLPDTLSVAYALLRRAREIAFALGGWLLLYADHATLRTIRTETAMATADATLECQSSKKP